MLFGGVLGGAGWFSAGVVHAAGTLAGVRASFERRELVEESGVDLGLMLRAGAMLWLWVVQRGTIVSDVDLLPYQRTGGAWPYLDWDSIAAAVPALEEPVLGDLDVAVRWSPAVTLPPASYLGDLAPRPIVLGAGVNDLEFDAEERYKRGFSPPPPEWSRVDEESA